MLSRGGFDALVTDLRMPKVDGLELLGRRPSPRSRAARARHDRVRRDRLGHRDRFASARTITSPSRSSSRSSSSSSERALARAASSARSGRASASARGASATPASIGASAARCARCSTSCAASPSADVPGPDPRRDRHRKEPRRPRHPREEPSARNGPFVTVNCAALPEPLLESELFGHVRGAFTGATREPRRAARRGRGRHALPRRDRRAARSRSRRSSSTCSSAQASAPSAATKERAVDVAHRRRDPPRSRPSASRAGEFREDLRYRLDVVSIEVPPLRQRRDDIPALASTISCCRRWPSTPSLPSNDSSPRRSRRCSTIAGPATCASWRTWWSGSCSSSDSRRFAALTCRRRSPPLSAPSRSG